MSLITADTTCLHTPVQHIENTTLQGDAYLYTQNTLSS